MALDEKDFMGMLSAWFQNVASRYLRFCSKMDNAPIPIRAGVSFELSTWAVQFWS
jgi:hypothetical protein